MERGEKEKQPDENTENEREWHCDKFFRLKGALSCLGNWKPQLGSAVAGGGCCVPIKEVAELANVKQLYQQLFSFPKFLPERQTHIS